uniref:Transport and Golgi organization protein 1 homolog n=1 Tax=Apteryx owenii TaxID=8824 RepID=A0A8B9P7E2_APTOW
MVAVVNPCMYIDMLMCRGKAMQDFKGPDCRFVNFKKGEAVYVYYKLIGKSTELWAGSVGSDFGYFPKDLLEINHNYTNEELELPTDETDFVCFDGGRDDFDNYNVDELLKSSGETIPNEGETESSDPGTKPVEGIKRDEEVEEVDTKKFLDALEMDKLELNTEEDKEAPSLTEEIDSPFTEGTENTGGDASVNSHEENSQGDQIAHEHLKGMLHEKLKGLESENTKNTSIPQDETSQLDKQSEEANAYTLLNRELSVNLKTKFGSTADAVVSDDEVTSLVTSPEDDFNEDLSIDAHYTEEEQDFADQPEEIPLLSFMTEEETVSLEDSEADENNGIESQNELDENVKGATELNNQKDDEKKYDSDTLILEHAFSESRRSGDNINVDRSESVETKEKQDEVMLISKKEAAATPQLEDLSKELLRKEPVEEILESDLKHKMLWEKTKEKGRAEDKPSVDVPAKPVEEVQNASQNDLRDTDLLKDKMEHGMPAVEKEVLKHEEDLKQTEADQENLKNTPFKEEPKIKRVNMKESPIGEGDPNHQHVSREAVEQPRPWENETEYSEADVKEQLSRNLGEETVFEESIQKSSPEGKSKGTTQNTNTGNFTQQGINRTEDGGSDSYLGTHLAREKTLRQEFQSEELDAEEDPDLKQAEEELLEDENAASAKLSQARLANVQGNKLNIRSTNLELEALSEATSGTANPSYKTDETGEEINAFSEEAKKMISMEDAIETGNKEDDVQVGEDSKLDEMERVKEDDEESSEAEEPSAVEEHNFKSSETEDSDDFNQRKEPLPEAVPQKDSKEMQNLERTRNDHQQSVYLPSPAVSVTINDTVISDYSESVKQLTIMRDFLDEKRIARLQKYLGLHHVVRIEAMFQDMKIELELARKASHNNEEIEKVLDQILEFSESSIMDVVGKVLDSRVAENKEEVVKEMDLYDEESALMDDIQELIYSLRSKYSSASESVPLAAVPEQEDYQLHREGRMLKCMHDGCSGEFVIIVFYLVATLPEDIRPGPDFHGLPWEPIIITALVGVATLAIIFWRTCLSVSILHALTEKQLAEKIKNLLQEKTEILEKMSEYDKKIKEAKESVKVAQKQKNVFSDEAAELKDTVKGLEETNRLLDDKVKNLHTMLETERKQNEKKQSKVRAITLMACVVLNLCVQIALNEAKLSEEKVKSELHHVQEENARLKKSKEQLLKEAEGWSERHTELSEQIKLYQKSQKDIEEALAYKENEIEVSSLQQKWGEKYTYIFFFLDNESEKMKTQIKQMMDVSRVKTMLSIVEEDRDLLQSKLSDEVTARHELEEQIKKLEHDSCSLQSAKARLENECKTLQQKVEILSELYQQKEMALQKKLTQEEYERQEKEQKLSAADEKAVLAIEEVKVYKQRIQDMEEELQKTERSYKNQIAAHEKKAHDNWLIARSAERALAEEKREAANLRQKLIEVNQKIVMLQRPLIVKPTPGRPDRQVPPRRGPLSRDGSFGPSPVSGGNPSPTQMIEVSGRPLSAPRREGSRGEFGAVNLAIFQLVNIYIFLLSLRIWVSDRGVQQCQYFSDANISPKGPPSFPGTPIMTSPVMGPPLPPPVRYGPPPAPLRGHFGPRPLPGPLGIVPLLYFLPGPPLGMRDLPPGSLPPPDPRGYGRGHPPFRPLGPHGPRDYPPGPRLPPPGLRDYTPSPNRDLTPSGPRDYPASPPPPPPPAGSKDYTQPPAQKP